MSIKMNYLWPALIIISLVCGAFGGCLDETLAAGLAAAEDSVRVVLSFAGMMCFWSGILKIAEHGGASGKLERLLRPVLSRLFPKLKKGGAALCKITENITANLLGMGNAATPAGIAAMAELDKENPTPETPSDEMCIFTILNTSSVQLIPATIISLRAAAGAENPSAIIIPVWICSAISLAAAMAAMKVILMRKRS